MAAVDTWLAISDKSPIKTMCVKCEVSRRSPEILKHHVSKVYTNYFQERDYLVILVRISPNGYITAHLAGLQRLTKSLLISVQQSGLDRVRSIYTAHLENLCVSTRNAFITCSLDVTTPQL